MSAWTAQEKAALIELYPEHTDSELCTLLNKTAGQLRGMKERLGLNSKLNLFTEEEKESIRKYYHDHTHNVISELKENNNEQGKESFDYKL